MRSLATLFVTLALVLPSAASAMTKQVGVLAGWNMAKLDIEGREGGEIRSSFGAGGVLDLGFNEHFGLRIEPMFLSKGGKATERNAYWGTIDGATFQLDYFDVPVLARYDMTNAPSRGYLLGGLAFGFATEQKVDLAQGNERETVDLGDVFNPIDITLNLGIGTSFPVGANRMTIDGRFSFGLMNINDGGTVTFQGAPLDVPDASTRTIDFRLFGTFLFPLN